MAIARATAGLLGDRRIYRDVDGGPMKLVRVFTIVAVWLLLSLVNFGALNGDARAESWYCDDPRRNSAFIMFVALIPGTGSFAAVFTTGLMEHGFSLKINCTSAE